MGLRPGCIDPTGRKKQNRSFHQKTFRGPGDSAGLGDMGSAREKEGLISIPFKEGLKKPNLFRDWCPFRTALAKNSGLDAGGRSLCPHVFLGRQNQLKGLHNRGARTTGDCGRKRDGLTDLRGIPNRRAFPLRCPPSPRWGSRRSSASATHETLPCCCRTAHTDQHRGTRR